MAAVDVRMEQKYCSYVKAFPFYCVVILFRITECSGKGDDLPECLVGMTLH